MEPLLLVFESVATGQRCAEALRSAGLNVQASCRSAAEALRHMSRLDSGGVAICSYRLADGTARTLLDNLPEGYSLLALARPEEQALLRGENVLFLSPPVTPASLVGAVHALQSARRPPRRKTAEEEERIARAKKLLMRTRGLREEEAHRFLQKQSMNRGLRVGDYALILLKEIDQK